MLTQFYYCFPVIQIILPKRRDSNQIYPDTTHGDFVCTIAGVSLVSAFKAEMVIKESPLSRIKAEGSAMFDGK